MLPDYIELLTYPAEYDGMGGTTIPDNPTVISGHPINCRITTMMGEKYKERYGYAGPEFRHVYIEPSIESFDNSGAQAIRLHSSSNTSVIGTSDIYRIVHMTHQRDEFGNLHHTTVVAEYADDLSA